MQQFAWLLQLQTQIPKKMPIEPWQIRLLVLIREVMYRTPS
jgi:hypothetical protein